jgi:hypothetical protein
MKLSDAIEQLRKGLEEHGDRELYRGVVFGKAPPVSQLELTPTVDNDGDRPGGLYLWLHQTQE